MSDPATDTRRDRRFAALTLMVIGALFSGVVLGVLVAVRVAEGPVPPDRTAFDEEREGLTADPTNEALLAELRGQDVRLREGYWANRRFHAWGAVLLAVGVGLLIVCGRWYASLDPKKPMPSDPVARSSPQLWLGMRRAALIASVAGAVVLVAAAVVMGLRGGAGVPGEGLALPERAPGDRRPAGPATLPGEDQYADNWPSFRGPTGMGIVPAGDWPQTWDASTGELIAWKSPVPMPGKSSPVIWGGRIFLTGADEANREVLCYARTTGELLWRTPVPAQPASADADPPDVFDETGYAAPTPATDGERVYALFANADLAAVDFEGQVVWSTNLGEPENVYGIATSLVTYGGRLIVQFDQGSDDDGLSALIAFDGRTGREAWRTDRPVANSWTSPVIVRDGDADLLITASMPYVIAYDPQSGEELWRVKALSGDVAPSPVYADGVVYVTNEYAVAMAIRTGGQGDVTESHVVWENDRATLAEGVSPVCDGRFFYQIHSSGIATCHDAATGVALWEKEFESPEGQFETFWASPTLVGGLVYQQELDGRMYIFELAGDYREVSTGLLDEKVYATPAFGDGRIYVRSEGSLYCIGASAEGAE